MYAGRLAVSGSEDKTVKLWDVHNHQCMHTFYEHSAAVRSVAWHPHGKPTLSLSLSHSVTLKYIHTYIYISMYVNLSIYLQRLS